MCVCVHVCVCVCVCLCICICAYVYVCVNNTSNITTVLYSCFSHSHILCNTSSNHTVCVVCVWVGGGRGGRLKEGRERKCRIQRPQDTDLWSSRRDSSLDTQAGWLRMALPILLLSTAKSTDHCSYKQHCFWVFSSKFAPSPPPHHLLY